VIEKFEENARRAADTGESQVRAFGLSAAHKWQSESGRAVVFDHRHIVEMRIVVRCSVW
jgi:hypothetical protein